MKKIIIFDFNRTIYDPIQDKIEENLDSILKNLIDKGYALYLVSHGIASDKSFIEEFKIINFFEETYVTRNKKKAFERILDKSEAQPEYSFVIGDRIEAEIRIGNILGFNTVWFRKGKLKNRRGEGRDEKANYVIGDLNELNNLIN